MTTPKQYSIRDLEVLSGIKAHTIRIWERRYQLFDPDRTESNIRLYTCTELKKLLNISMLIEKGFKISKLSQMTDKSLTDVVTNTFENSIQAKDFYISQINAMVVSMLELDEIQFEKTFSGCVLRYGLENTIMQVVYPFLNKVGMMWCINEVSPAQEHFTSNLIKQKLHTAIDGLMPATKTTPADTFLLYLSEDEDHEIGLLLAHYLLKKSGYKVIYLGPNVPFADLKEVVRISQPQNMFTLFVVPRSLENTQSYLDKLKKEFITQKIFLSGNTQMLDNLKLDENIERLKTVYDLEEKIKVGNF